MSGETDQALEMHNKYAQFQLGDKVCFTPGTPSNLDGWEKLDRTLHLKPFLALLVREMKIRFKRDVSIRSLEVAKANWLGSEDLLRVTISASDFITAIYNNNPDDGRSRNYLAYSDRLADLKLVPTHMGVVVLDAAVDWLEAIDATWETSVQRLFRIRNLVETHLNFCSVSTIGVGIVNGIHNFKYTTIRYGADNAMFNITTRVGAQMPKVEGSLVNSWDDTEGVYALHKGEIIERLTNEQAKLIEKYREAQIRHLNEFIRSAK